MENNTENNCAQSNQSTSSDFFTPVYESVLWSSISRKKRTPKKYINQEKHLYRLFDDVVKSESYFYHNSQVACLDLHQLYHFCSCDEFDYIELHFSAFIPDSMFTPVHCHNRVFRENNYWEFPYLARSMFPNVNFMDQFGYHWDFYNRGDHTPLSLKSIALAHIMAPCAHAFQTASAGMDGMNYYGDHDSIYHDKLAASLESFQDRFSSVPVLWSMMAPLTIYFSRRQIHFDSTEWCDPEDFMEDSCLFNPPSIEREMFSFFSNASTAAENFAHISSAVRTGLDSFNANLQDIPNIPRDIEGGYTRQRDNGINYQNLFNPLPGFTATSALATNVGKFAHTVAHDTWPNWQSDLTEFFLEVDDGCELYAILAMAVENWAYMPLPIFVSHTIYHILKYFRLPAGMITLVNVIMSEAITILGGLSAPMYIGETSDIEKEMNLSTITKFISAFGPALKSLLSNAAKMIRDVNTMISFISNAFDFVKSVVNWLFPATIADTDLQSDLETFLCVVKYYRDEANHHKLASQVHREIVLDQHSRYRKLMKYFANLSRKHPNAQSYSQFHIAAAQYEILCSDVQHHGALGSVTARHEPHVCVFTGESNIGKSVLQSYLQGVAVNEVSDFMTLHEKENPVCTLNLALAHFDNYTGQFIVCLDDLFTTAESTACSGAAKFNAMVSNADYVVPMAKLEQKGHKFTSRIILGSTNNPYPRLPDVTYHQCIWRRRDLLVEVKVKPGVSRKTLSNEDAFTVDNLAHLSFRLKDPINPQGHLSDWMDFPDFELRYRTSLKAKFEHQELIVKKLQNHMSANLGYNTPKEEILREIIDEEPDHFFFDNFKVYCKDAACMCLNAYKDAERFIYDACESTASAMKNIFDSCLTTVKDFVNSILEIAQPSYKYLVRFGLVAAGLVGAYKLWKAFGKSDKIEKEMKVEVSDWRAKNAEHFKNRPPTIPKKDWRQVLVSEEISKLSASDKHYYTIVKCNGNQLILERADEIKPQIQIKSSDQGLVGKPTIIENPYKLAEVPQAVGVPCTKTIAVESQNTEEALTLIKKHLFYIQSKNGGMHATHVIGQCILAPFHFFHLLKEGDVFDIHPCMRGAKKTIYYHPSHCVQLKDSDVCLYWIAGDMCSSSMLKQFVTLKQLEQISYVQQLSCLAYDNNYGTWVTSTHTNAMLDKYTDKFTENGRFVDKQVMSFSGLRAPGRCGALYVTSDFHPNVLGFHIGFRAENNSTFLRLITREEIEFMANHLHHQVGVPLGIAPEVPSIISECDGEGIGANMPFIGYMRPDLARHQPKKHAKIPSLAYGKIYEVRKGNSVLSKHDPRIKDEYRSDINILESGLLKYSTPYQEYPWELIPLFEDFHYMRFKNFRTPTKPCVREYDEVINGIRNDDDSFVSYFRGINMKSSPGFGWSTSLTEPGKTGLFYQIPTSYGIHYTMKEELSAAVHKLEQELKDGILPHAITVNCLKSELRTHAKIEQGNTRNFVVFPIEWTIVSSRYFKDWAVAMAETHGDSSAQIGIDPTGLDWHEMVNDLMKYSSKNGFDGDYKAYDGPVFYQQVIPIVKAINRWYNDGEINARVRHLLAVRMFYSYILSGNRVHYKNQGQTSGNILTSPLNCEVNSQLFGYAYLMCWFEECRKDPNLKISTYNLANMQDFVCSKFYGDDNIHSVREEIIHWFYPERIAKYINATGFNITDAAKTGILEWKPVVDLQFLKMNIGIMNGYYVGKLDTVSIEEMSNWIRDNHLSTPGEKLRDNFDTMLRFAFAHGRKYHDEMLGKVNDFLQQIGMAILPVTYNDRYRVFLDQKIGAEHGEYIGDVPRILTVLYNDTIDDFNDNDSDATSDYKSVIG